MDEDILEAILITSLSGFRVTADDRPGDRGFKAKYGEKTFRISVKEITECGS